MFSLWSSWASTRVNIQSPAFAQEYAEVKRVGKEYKIEERVGTLNIDDEIIVRANHGFANGPTTLPPWECSTAA